MHVQGVAQAALNTNLNLRAYSVTSHLHEVCSMGVCGWNLGRRSVIIPFFVWGCLLFMFAGWPAGWREGLGTPWASNIFFT